MIKVILIFLIIILMASGCTGVAPSSDTLPVISTFTTTPESITTGESSTLSWDVSGAVTVTVGSKIGSAALTRTSVVSPATTTTYTLTATNAAGSVSAIVTVLVAIPILTGKIAFYSDRDGLFEIYVMNTDGSNQTDLKNHTYMIGGRCGHRMAPRLPFTPIVMATRKSTS